MKPDSTNLIKIATLKKPHGIKGWLWVFSETEDRSAIFDIKPWFMKTAKGFVPLTVTNWRRQGTGIVAQFEQVPDRNMAETMQGVTIWATKDNLTGADEDEFYWSDLVGLNVYNLQGDCLGVVKQLFETSAHSIMEVVPTEASIDSEERLIPWHKQTIHEVDLSKKTITVDWEADF